jgi:hypothetical protein
MRRAVERLRGARTFVDIEIVENDDVAAAQMRSELGLDVSIERRAIDGSLDDPGRHQLLAAQAGDEGLRVPFAEGRIGDQPLAAPAAAAQRSQVGFDAGSSMKTSRAGWARIRGWRWSRHSPRAALTSERSCSDVKARLFYK